MDVVRRNIEALRGKVEIESTPGEGSVFRMRLPLTMAIIDGMVIRVGEPALRGADAVDRAELSVPRRTRSTRCAGRGEMVKVRGELLPIHRLNRLFQLSEGIDDPCEALFIILESNDARCCLLVDEIIGQQQVVIKSLGRA
jgi:two-component system chemotaxis sensor kinase CheA